QSGPDGAPDRAGEPRLVLGDRTLERAEPPAQQARRLVGVEEHPDGERVRHAAGDRPEDDRQCCPYDDLGHSRPRLATPKMSRRSPRTSSQPRTRPIPLLVPVAPSGVPTITISPESPPPGASMRHPSAPTEASGATETESKVSSRAPDRSQAGEPSASETTRRRPLPSVTKSLPGAPSIAPSAPAWTSRSTPASASPPMSSPAWRTRKRNASVGLHSPRGGIVLRRSRLSVRSRS